MDLTLAGSVLLLSGGTQATIAAAIVTSQSAPKKRNRPSRSALEAEGEALRAAFEHEEQKAITSELASLLGRLNKIP